MSHCQCFAHRKPKDCGAAAGGLPGRQSVSFSTEPYHVPKRLPRNEMRPFRCEPPFVLCVLATSLPDDPRSCLARLFNDAHRSLPGISGQRCRASSFATTSVLATLSSGQVMIAQNFEMFAAGRTMCPPSSSLVCKYADRLIRTWLTWDSGMRGLTLSGIEDAVLLYFAAWQPQGPASNPLRSVRRHSRKTWETSMFDRHQNVANGCRSRRKVSISRAVSPNVKGTAR